MEAAFSYHRSMLALIKRYHNVAIFIGGFLFDLLTIRRIDSWPDLILQLAYLAALTGLLVYQYRENEGLWSPSEQWASFWKYNVEYLHFFYGGLLSAYVVLYFKSATGARPLVFFLVLVALMFLNEMPQVRKLGYRLRLGLYAFCVCSFMTYFIPVLIGRMGSSIFYLSVLLSGVVVWMVAGLLDRSTNRIRLFVPAAGILTIILVLYTLKLIPPVPLSVQFQGIYHDIRKDNGSYALVYEGPRFYLFWRKDSRPFHKREGDVIHYFARVFAPARFQHQVMVRWEYLNPITGEYETSDVVPFHVTGGRADGFRGFVAKNHFQAGKWRVTTETEDGRPISILSFKVVEDTSSRDRQWAESRM